MDIRLYRAADDDILIGPTSFAVNIEDARASLDNKGFGGKTLYYADANIDPGTVLVVRDESDEKQVAAIRKAAGLSRRAYGAVTADFLLAQQPVVDALVDAGYEWVHLLDTFPEGAEVFTWLYAGDEPELVAYNEMQQNPVENYCGSTRANDAKSADIATLKRRLDVIHRQIDDAQTSLDLAAINPWEWAEEAHRATAGTKHANWANREALKLAEKYRKRSASPGQRRNPAIRLPDEDARAAERALHGHYEAKHREGVEAWKRDIALRYAGALAHWSSLGMPALRAEANRRGIRTSAKVTKSALVTRLARILVPEWREGTEEKLPRTCRPPKLTKQDKAMLEQAPEEEQELAESLTRFCDATDPDDARERCAELDAAAQAAGYVSVADAMTGWGMSRVAVEKFYKLCPAQMEAEPIPF